MKPNCAPHKSCPVGHATPCAPMSPPTRTGSQRTARPICAHSCSGVLISASLLLLCALSAHAQGGVPLWTNRYDGPLGTSDEAAAIAVDGAGNVVVVGASSHGTNDDFVTIKYSNAGVPLWTNRFDG